MSCKDYAEKFKIGKTQPVHAIKHEVQLGTAYKKLQ